MSADETQTESEIAQRLEELRERIASASARSGREATAVTLVGVTKHQSAARIAAAVRAGLRQLGANYVQELRDKRPEIEALVADAALCGRLVWRMIGGMQRNKAQAAVTLFDAVDSVDRISLARELDRRAGDAGRKLDVCLQVNLSGESQKSGIAPEALPELLAGCAQLENLRVRGLMTVPAAAADPSSSRPAFAQLRELRDRLRSSQDGSQLQELSMGMSGDFEVAIEEGSTLVRVGTALFGPRLR